MRQIRILQFSGVAALAYGTVLLFRGGPDVQMTVAGMEGSVSPESEYSYFIWSPAFFSWAGSVS